MSTAAINPASAVAGKACDHSIRLVRGEPKYAGRGETDESEAVPEGRTSQGQQPESAARGTGGRRRCLVPPPPHIDDRDTPLSFKLQQGSEQRQGTEGFQIGRLKISD